MWSSLTNIRIALAVLCSMLYLFPPIPVSAQEAEGDLIQSMYEASESYVEFDPISDEQFSEIVSSNDEVSESESMDNVVDDDNVDNVENVEEVENTDSIENTDEEENKDTEQADNETETDQNDNEQKTETDSEQKENVSNEQEQDKNEQEQEPADGEQEETVNIEQLYEVQVYILGILVFFVVCFILRMIYKFFNMFFPI